MSIISITPPVFYDNKISNYYGILFSNCTNFQILDVVIHVTASFGPSTSYGQNVYGFIIRNSNYLISRTSITTSNAGNGASGGKISVCFLKNN